MIEVREKRKRKRTQKEITKILTRLLRGRLDPVMEMAIVPTMRRKTKLQKMVAVFATRKMTGISMATRTETAADS